MAAIMPNTRVGAPWSTANGTGGATPWESLVACLARRSRRRKRWLSVTGDGLSQDGSARSQSKSPYCAGRSVVAVPALQDSVVAIPYVLQPGAVLRADPHSACTRRDKTHRRCTPSTEDAVLHPTGTGFPEAPGPCDNLPGWSRWRLRATVGGGPLGSIRSRFYVSSTCDDTAANLVTRIEG